MKITHFSILSTALLVSGSAIFTNRAIASQQQQPSAGRTIEDYRIEYGNNVATVDGICKFDETSALCWKPDGSPNPSLTDRIKRAIASNNPSSGRQFTVTFGKKQRALFIKVTRSSNSNYGNELAAQEGRDGNLWSNYSGMFGNANSSDFDGSYTGWNVYLGKFDLDAKMANIQLINTTYGRKSKIIPIQVGRFEVNGNTYEITSVGPPPPPKSNPPLAPGYVQLPPPRLVVNIKVVQITNPNTSLSLSVGDTNGKGYEYATKDGKPATYQDYNDWQRKHMANPNHEQPPFNYPGGASFDGASPISGSPVPLSIYLQPEFSKTIIANSTDREVYNIVGLHLEPN